MSTGRGASWRLPPAPFANISSACRATFKMSPNNPPSNGSRRTGTAERPRLDWREIAEKAATERDPRKLIRLVKALCDRLEELHASTETNRKDGDGSED